MPSFPEVDVPLVGDMSSDYLSRPVPWERFDLVYGGAQKNLGPAGLAVRGDPDLAARGDRTGISRATCGSTRTPARTA